MKGHLGFVIKPQLFAPVAYVLTTGTSIAVPVGAKTMKAWAVGRGGSADGNLYAQGAQAGGVAYKTWSVFGGGQNVAYSFSSGNANITFQGVTITGEVGADSDDAPTQGGYSSSGGSYDGGTAGGPGGFAYEVRWGGAVGHPGVDSGTSANGRLGIGDVSGLVDAADLAGAKVVEDQAEAPAFGSGGFYEQAYASPTVSLSPGYGGGAADSGQSPGSACVVFYFT